MTSPHVVHSCTQCVDRMAHAARLEHVLAVCLRDRDAYRDLADSLRLSARDVEVVRAARGLVATWDDAAATEDVVVAAAERLRAAVEADGANGSHDLTLAGGVLEGMGPA